MDNDGHYYVEGYSAQLDPYAQDNGVLKNRFGIADSASLNEIEADIAGLQLQKLLTQPVPSSFTRAGGAFLELESLQFFGKRNS